MSEETTKSETEDKQVRLVDEFKKIQWVSREHLPRMSFEDQCDDLSPAGNDLHSDVLDFGDWLLGQVKKGRERGAELKAEVKRLQRESVEHMKSGQSR